jgi:transcriptional regulator with XRE-family HTH domain
MDKYTHSENLRDYLRWFFEASGFTQEDLSEVSGVPQPTISNFLTGKVASPRFDMAMQLKQAAEELLGQPPGRGPDVTNAQAPQV